MECLQNGNTEAFKLRDKRERTRVAVQLGHYRPVLVFEDVNTLAKPQFRVSASSPRRHHAGRR